MRGVSSSQTYFALDEFPTFRFTLPEADQMTMEHVCVTFENYYLNNLKAYVLNPSAGAWEEFTPNQDLPGAERYFDREGQLTLQFRPVNADQYSSIPAPALTVEGRKKHAAD